MAVYRESPAVWKRYVPYLIGIAVLIGAILLLVALNYLASKTNPTPDRVGDALNVIGQSVDLYGIEIYKIIDGTPPAQTGAPGAIDKAQATFKSVEADFRKLDAKATDSLAFALNTLKENTASVTHVFDSDVAPWIASANTNVLVLRKAYLASH